MERFGVEYALQSPEIRQKIGETNLRKYGVSCVLNYEEFKEKSRQTNLREYGVEHHLQNAEYAEKHLKASYKIKQYTLPSGKVIYYQGYEIPRT